MNLDLLCENTFSHQHELLHEASRRRMLRTAAIPMPERRRSRLAFLLRRLADWLEPTAVQPRVGLLRAVAHHEIDVEQAMRLLNSNGHRSRVQ
jgi:hypothetical protein